MAQYGVIPTPTVRKVELNPDDVVLIVASDGVWDMMGPTQAVQHVMASLDGGMSTRQAAEKLVRDSIDMALEADGDADNTTAVVILLPR